jgi:hypothetical protein
MDDVLPIADAKASPRFFRRTLRALACLLALGMLATLVIVEFGGEGTQSIRADINLGFDFLAFWTGGTLLELGRGAELYVPKAMGSLQHQFAIARIEYWAVYPPPLYNVMEWVQPLGYTAAARLWLLSIPLIVIAACAVLRSALPELGPHRDVALWLGAFAPFSFMALITGQPSGTWLFALVVGVALLRGGRPVLAGIALGWLCAKPSLGVTAAAWLVLSRQWRAFGGFAVGGASLVLASVAVGGVTPWLAWVEWLSDGDFAKFSPARNRQLTLRALFTRPIWSSPLRPSVGMVGMGMGLAAAAYLGRSASRFQPHSREWLLPAGAALSGTMLALPYILEYDAGFHLLGLAAAAVYVPHARRPRLGAVLTFGAWLAPALHELTRVTKFSWGSLLLALWLVWLVWEVYSRDGTRLALQAADDDPDT